MVTGEAVTSPGDWSRVVDSSTSNVAPLHQRMIEDMRTRKMGGKTQIGRIRAREILDLSAAGRPEESATR